jgi:predicted DNA-binding transcriptional regulator AlpA
MSLDLTPDTLTPELLTLPQVAALCGVSQRTVWGWARDGISPPPVKIGKGTVRHVRSAYLAWCAGGCKPIQGGAVNGK